MYSEAEKPAAFPAARTALRIRKRNALRAGFGLVIALLIFSTLMAFEIQRGLSAETAEIYHRHMKQADLLFSLRRTLWLGANVSRDFFLNPSADRLQRFQADFHRHSDESRTYLAELERLPIPKDVSVRLRARVQEYWSVLERTPAAAAELSAAERFEFVQEQIVRRRNAIGDMVREFNEISQKALIESESELARSRRAAGSRLLITLALSVVCALVVAGYSLLHADRLERQTVRQYEQVEQAKAELQQLSARLMEIQEQERTRLSRELHDEIGQTLATLRLEISRAESLGPDRLGDLRERLAGARSLAEKTMQTVRNISLLLRPALLDDLGLGPALQWLTEDFTRRTRVPCHLSEQSLEEERLPDAVRTCVYRVLQEALHNCEKHAGASEVRVAVTGSADSLEVAIADNGRGFQPGAAGTLGRAARFGLIGMRERAAALGGTLEIDAAPGKGARLVLRLPLSGRPEPEQSAVETHA